MEGGIPWSTGSASGAVAAFSSVLFIVAYVISGSQPKVVASADQLRAFYDGHPIAMFVMSGAFGLWRAGISRRRSSRRE